MTQNTEQNIPPKYESNPSVTVLIAARNEEAHIGQCLDSLTHQSYDRSHIQIVVVNDRSTDSTPLILQKYEETFPGLIDIVHIQEESLAISPKKHALSLGMLEARGEIILTTDADCVMPGNWISSILEEFKPNTGLILGLTSFYREPDQNPLVWGVQSLEFISYSIVSAALIGLNFPIHGNANNMAYRRKVYEEAQGFQSHNRVISGDDDFLIQSIYALGKWKIQYAVSSDSQVETEPAMSIRQFWEQRKRWASKCGFYRKKQLGFLAGIFTYYSAIPVLLVAGLFSRKLLLIGLASWLIKTGMDFLVMFAGARIFRKKHLLKWFPFTCLIHIPLILAAVLAGSFGEFTWKGQTVRKTR